MSLAIRIENVSKLYRLGTVGTGTISHDFNRWWFKVRGKEDPYTKVGQVNDRARSLENGDKSYAKNVKAEYVWALKDVSLDVRQGEILGIIGRNGAGKSTLLKLLSRVTSPTYGSIKARGRIASLLEVGTGFHFELTGRENIYMNGAILGMRRKEIFKQLSAIVEFSGCARYLDTPVKRYSSGMTVRLGFAVAAHLQSEILIVDEVLAVGDSEFQNRCISKLQELASSGRTVILVSHQLPQVVKLASRTAVLANGILDFAAETPDAISRYLRTSKVNNSMWCLGDDEILNKNKILEVSIAGADSQHRAEFRGDEGIFVTVRFRLKEVLRMQIAARVNRTDGTTVFTTASTDFCEHTHREHCAGLYTCRFQIPSQLLLPGRYSLLVALNNEDWQILDIVEGSIVFQVIDLGSICCRDRRLGDVAPVVEWKVDR